jgi:hypothetical protein
LFIENKREKKQDNEQKKDYFSIIDKELKKGELYIGYP